MINNFSLKHDSAWLYVSFVKRLYRINRKSGNIQWSNHDFETVYEVDYNEAMTIYDVLCSSKDGCPLAHEYVNINSLSTVRTGNFSWNDGFFQDTAAFFMEKLLNYVTPAGNTYVCTYTFVSSFEGGNAA